MGVTFTKARQVVSEHEGVVEFEIDVTGSLEKAVEVVFTTVDGTATCIVIAICVVFYSVS